MSVSPKSSPKFKKKLRFSLILGRSSDGEHFSKEKKGNNKIMGGGGGSNFDPESVLLWPRCLTPEHPVY